MVVAAVQAAIFWPFFFLHRVGWREQGRPGRVQGSVVRAFTMAAFQMDSKILKIVGQLIFGFNSS